MPLARQSILQTCGRGYFVVAVPVSYTHLNKATAGEWFIMNNEADGVTTIAWEETGDAKYPNAMKSVSYTHLDVYKRQVRSDDYRCIGIFVL